MELTKQQLKEGNILLSKYLFGEPDAVNYYQIGYRDSRKWYRKESDLHDNFWPNFHNDWELLISVVSKIAKNRNSDPFSDEGKLQEEIKDSLFDYSYDIIICWDLVIKYVKLKMAV